MINKLIIISKRRKFCSSYFLNVNINRYFMVIFYNLSREKRDKMKKKIKPGEIKWRKIMTLKYRLAEDPQSLAFQLQEPGNVANFIPWKNTVQFDVQNKSFFSKLYFSSFYDTRGEHISDSEINVSPNYGSKTSRKSDDVVR